MSTMTRDECQEQRISSLEFQVKELQKQVQEMECVINADSLYLSRINGKLTEANNNLSKREQDNG